jgi:alpha-N-arabinofuranosidase
VRGFTLEHAAPNWAPPTAEQVGLIGTHWSKGWVIEDNTIRYSICTGITLGKHGDQFDNTSQNSAVGYVETIKRAHAFRIPWTSRHIGHHVVRNNHIAHCEQAGIVGSMGAAFSTVSGNTIHHINRRGLFDGAEQAGIKFHGAIDATISHNHIHHAMRGIWLDWMTQGTRVTANLLHDNGPREDLFVEVNHGPFLVDNNILLSPTALLEASGGGAYAHNLFAGQIRVRQERTRDTPYHPAHSTRVAGLAKVVGDDERFYNNLFVGPAGLTTYDSWGQQLRAAGNVYIGGAEPSQFDQDQIVDTSFDPQLKLITSAGSVTLQIALDPAWARRQCPLVTSELLGNAKVPNLPYVQPDDSPYRLDTDYLGSKRNASHPFPGPFEHAADRVETVLIQVVTEDE